MAKGDEATITGMPTLRAKGRLCESLVFKAGGGISLPKLRRFFRSIFKYCSTSIWFCCRYYFGYSIFGASVCNRWHAFLWSFIDGVTLSIIFSLRTVPCPVEKTRSTQATVCSTAGRYTPAECAGKPTRTWVRSKSFLQTSLTITNC